ncbi:MAG: sulfite exporter TauE/SafE family protein [Sulfurimonas sp.]|uniref:sulfite exporter TauE/SafE family protein n=1 Tax=Sulfurimonas sp. TaxID=2022749 RepID=UPI00262B9BCD|nr:sulfite exporter TauE/SafE family protein [Sulfurimonas sp.]MCW8894493.1 sulfite exporter TauE/SafE family protein [Sulfurimonas sp.]MCW8954110.1 sulfite exporter TauE/SafE family protein [Sulfurimonas sp.]MCW9067826.1 sulfite exporter TauE/SafE family protein [Sulfurimonas sp.]
MTELIFLGIGVGALSGFFGIGGGTILIPLLLLLGYETKAAIGISVVQMVFSSIYGSYLNNKKGTLDISMVMIIGAGGFIGAIFSGFLTSSFDDRLLESIFLAFALFALLRMFFKTHKNKPQKDVNRVALFIIGLLIGAISMTIGVGGGILLVPVLVSFLHVELNKAISAGLFFVVFSSISGLISHSLSRHIDFESGIIIGLASLLGVYIGIVLKDRVDSVLQKRLLAGFYLLIVVYLINRIFV